MNKRFSIFGLLQLFCLTSMSIFAKAPQQDSVFLFMGTYSGNESKGIYVYNMNKEDGHLSFVTSFQTNNPSYLCIHPNKKWIYAVGESDNGTVNAFEFDAIKKKLKLLNSVSSEGKNPCFISIDKSGKYVMIANYSSGNVALYPIDKDGKLQKASSVVQHTGKSVNASRQEAPHAHMIAQEAQNDIVYASDLGIDKILAYTIDKISNKLIPTNLNAELTPGSGPRHFTAHKKLPIFYVLNELTGTIDIFKVQQNGALNPIQNISNMKEGDTRYPGSADIHITPDGKYLYATNRSTINSIGMYSIDQKDGKLTLLGFEPVKGDGPRNFSISPDGKYLLVANQNSGNVIVFSISYDGTLKDSGLNYPVPNVVCLKFM